VVRFTRRDVQLRNAELDHFKEVHGARHGMRRATFSGKHLIPRYDPRRPVLWRTNYVLRQRFYSTFHLAPENLQAYLDDLNRFKPEILDGFTSCMVDLCLFARKSGQEFHFRPVAVFPTSEPLYPHQRQILRESFGVEPRDQYASSEGAPFIVECPLGRLHYLLHTGVIEVDDDGEALVTGFHTYGTPLIRYRIGDRIDFAPPDARCTCGWDTPLVERIEGRTIDYLVSPARGKIYSPNLANVVKNLPNSIVQTQFVQRDPLRVQVRLVVDPARFVSERDVPMVEEEVRRRLGDEIGVGVDVVPALERAASGKQPLVINQVR
jgi:phenylacetate-CoA ligase